MKQITFCFLFLSLLLLNCERDKTILDPASSGDYTIKYGTSFGECRRYCKKELIVNEMNVNFTAFSWQPQQFPEKSISGRLTLVEYQHLTSLINMNEILKYDDIIGCPDCADGGAEWIQIIQDDQTKIITFEYGTTLDSINELIEQLRKIFKTYDGKLFPPSI